MVRLKVPNWKNAIPKDYLDYPVQIDLDIDKILRWRRLRMLRMKSKKRKYLVKIENTYFDLRLLALAAEFMKYFGTQKFNLQLWGK